MTVAAHPCISKADDMTRQLQALSRLPPKAALESSEYKTASLFLKKVPPSLKNTAEIKACKTELLAFSLGIQSCLFTKPQNTDFQKFAQKPPLAPYLAFYEDQLETRGDEIYIRSNGAFCRWSSIRMSVMPPDPLPDQYQPWVYGQRGAQLQNTFMWSCLQPYKTTTLTEETAPSYVAKICSCTSSRPRFGGDHSWLEFVQIEGREKREYSVGLFSSYRKEGHPLRLQQGFLMSPDISRFFLGDTISELVFTVTQKIFHKIQRTLCEDKEKEKRGDLPIQLIGKNCTWYAKSILEKHGVKLPSIECSVYALLGEKYGLHPITFLAGKINSFIPRPLSTLISTSISWPINGIFYLYGAGRSDVKAEDPRLPSKWAILFTNARTDHPWGVRNAVVS